MKHPPRLPDRYLPARTLTPAFRIVLKNEPAQTGVDGAAIVHYQQALHQSPATCFLCSKVHFTPALMPGAYVVVDTSAGGLRCGALCDGCLSKEPTDWLRGRIVDRLSRDMRAARIMREDERRANVEAQGSVGVGEMSPRK